MPQPRRAPNPFFKDELLRAHRDDCADLSLMSPSGP
jgi:hypothetical protein